MPPDHVPQHTGPTGGLTVSPALDAVLDLSHDVPPQHALIDLRIARLSGMALGIGVVGALIAQLLTRLIALFTNIAFFGRWSLESVSPADNTLGWLVVVVPVVGALIVGVMARYGSKAIRGHGIPEAMEQVLTNQSRIPARIMFLKPLSAAISIGTGGPFGAEGPIIATGSALGSVIGQIISTTTDERKSLLAAGAAAGMAATFGCPVSAVLLAIELLLFEFSPRSIIPVALASAASAGVRMAIEGAEPVFAMPDLTAPSLGAMAAYIVLGAVVGVAAVVVTRVVYAVEDAFEHLPIHWMWWPAVGAIAVGVAGYFTPRTLGVGYTNITDIISNRLALNAIFMLCTMKFISWSISLGSGTSGGTLAPLFTLGGGLGALLGAGAAHLFPVAQIDVRVAALVGMAAMFAGASRALLASTVFAFETTLQPLGLLPLLGGCTAAYLVSCLLMRTTIMTEKIARRGIAPPQEYIADPLDQVLVRDVATRNVITINGDDLVQDTRRWIQTGEPGTSHQGYPVVNARGLPLGVVTRRSLLADVPENGGHVRDLCVRPLKFLYDDCTVRQAAEHMVRHDIGRLPVLSRSIPARIEGIITRSDILSVYERKIAEAQRQHPTLRVRMPGFRS